MSAPRVLSQVSPVFSDEDRAEGLKGKVVMSIVVNVHGRAEQIRVIRSKHAELS